ITGVRRLLGSVSARVVAEAPCTVTVVRAAHADHAALPAGNAEPLEPDSLAPQPGSLLDVDRAGADDA
ncbi:MAG TPA: hypothetical protein VIK70_11020, partial [Lysobacter sp.]